MKMYDKEDLAYVDGYLVTEDGDVVMPGKAVIDQANLLDLWVQKQEYMDAQPKAQKAPSLKGFEPASEHGIDGFEFTADTPVLDKRAAETLALMDEIDDAHIIDKMNETLAQFGSLLAFAKNGKVVSSDSCDAKFDLPRLGNPLFLEPSDIISAIAKCYGLAKVDE